jgi:hypothetical protein
LWHQFNCDSVNIMVIVMPTRSDLRDEFAMVDDVFALSPISARPALPSEADYEAIRDAFMETSRGRWFLGEFAKRNRNADTSMVLDAVARIEHALAAQQHLQQQEMQEAREAEASALPEVLAAIRHAVAGAEGAAAAALDSLALELNLTPVRKGIRIIKEISWRWREIGADSRICDLIDSQLVAIDAACDQLTSVDPRAALIASFGAIKAQLDSFEQAEAGVPAATDGSVAPAAEMDAQPEVSVPGTSETAGGAAAMPVEAAAAAHPAIKAAVPVAESVAATAPAEPLAPIAAGQAPRAQETTSEASVEAAEPKPQSQAQTAAQAEPPVASAAAPLQAMGERAEIVDKGAASTAEHDDLDTVVVTKADADAQDEAILDLVAAEMGAPDLIEDEEVSPASSIHFEIEEAVSVDDDIVATFAESTVPEPEPESKPAPAVASVPSAPEPAPAAMMASASAAAPSLVSPAAPVPPTPIPSSWSAVAPMLERPAASAQPVVQEPAKPAPVVQPVVQQQPRPAATLPPLPKSLPQPSLGSTLLASGLLQRPLAANDPLLPIRRMTQPEKIAFFS